MGCEGEKGMGLREMNAHEEVRFGSLFRVIGEPSHPHDPKETLRRHYPLQSNLTCRLEG